MGKNFAFFFDSSRKSGSTDPLEPITLPYLTTEKVSCPPTILFAEIKILSEASFVTYKLIGLTLYLWKVQ